MPCGEDEEKLVRDEGMEEAPGASHSGECWWPFTSWPDEEEEGGSHFEGSERGDGIVGQTTKREGWDYCKMGGRVRDRESGNWCPLPPFHLLPALPIGWPQTEARGPGQDGAPGDPVPGALGRVTRAECGSGGVHAEYGSGKCLQVQ